MNERNTLQKGLIKDAVNSLKNHPCAEEIFSFIRQNHPTVSKGTVYRNLSQMAQSGEILRVAVPGSADRFDFFTDKHYHILCSSCGRVFDIEMPYQSNLNEAAEKNGGSQIISHDIVFKGFCSCCKKL